MAKIDELLKQKEELEKEIKKEQNKEIKLTERDLKILSHFIAELVIPPFLDNTVPGVKTTIHGDFYKYENKSVITLENFKTKTKYLTITIKGE